MRVHITEVKAGDRLSEDIYSVSGFPILSSGTPINEKELSRLYQHQIEHLAVDRDPEAAEPDGPRSSINPLLKPLYLDAVAGVERMFVHALEDGRIREEDVRTSFRPLVDSLRSERDVVSLLLLLNSQDDYTFQHSVQVGLLCYYIARWLDWNEQRTLLAAKAGFMHNIGISKIPGSILNKPGKLTEEEFRIIRSHPELGFDLLKDSVPEPAVALAALQHHERMDGSGYPAGLKGDSIHRMARIVAVADIYSAMISSRVYRAKRDMLFVLKEIYAMSFDQLDPEIAHTFIRYMVLNFIGKRVLFTNGETGVIVMTHPTDFFRPLVRIGEEFIDMSVQDTYVIEEVFI